MVALQRFAGEVGDSEEEYDMLRKEGLLIQFLRAASWLFGRWLLAWSGGYQIISGACSIVVSV